MLSGKKLIESAKKVVLLYPEIFTALEQYDKTHKLKKINYKERANFTIDNDILREFRDHCKKKGFNMSAKLEQYMAEEVKS